MRWAWGPSEPTEAVLLGCRAESRVRAPERMEEKGCCGHTPRAREGLDPRGKDAKGDETLASPHPQPCLQLSVRSWLCGLCQAVTAGRLSNCSELHLRGRGWVGT